MLRTSVPAGWLRDTVHGFLYRPHYYNATVNSTRGYNHAPPRPLLSRGRVENSSGGITRRQPVCASRAGWFLLHVGEDGGGGRRDRMIEKERNDFFFGDCEHGVVNFLAAIVCNEAASREKKGERSGKIIDIVSGRLTFRSNVIRTLR